MPSSSPRSSTLGVGLAVSVATARFRRELQPRDGFLLVSLIWGVLPAFAALPLMLALPGLSVTDAYFEAMSGFSASGATVLSGLDALPLSINVWRCFLNYVGGLGIVVLAVAVLPMLGVGGTQLFRAETPGPMKDQKLTPRISSTARGLWIVYAVLSIACLVAYRVAGMELGRCADAHVLDREPGRAVVARRELRPLEFGRHRGRSRWSS